MPSILFVCTGNLCRSPMASALFRERVRRALGADDWRVESAGVWAQEGRPALENTRAALQEVGLDIADHRSRGVSEAWIRSFHLILTMEWGQKEALQVAFPDIADRIYLLTEMAGQTHQVRDPIGGDLDDFRRTRREIDRLLAQGFERIARIAQRNR